MSNKDLNPTFEKLLAKEIKHACAWALCEDLGGESIACGLDVSAELIDADKNASATLISRDDGIFCGKAWIEQVFELLGSSVEVKFHVEDGALLSAGDTICQLQGNARALLTGERTAMNFAQTLSAVATITATYQKLIAHTNCQLLDTRKTIPGMRFGQKYAVSCGGGKNHRLGLWDAYLIKENHIMAAGSIDKALSKAKQAYADKLLEIEVEDLNELVRALDGGAQVIMLDNFSLDDMTEAIAIRNKHRNKAKLEASGNVSVETINQIAETGVDYISVGALTKHIQALDLSMRIQLD